MIFKNNKGITLIALVITIIVLIILAGISIITLTGENGIIYNAQKAKGEIEKANAIEQAKLDILKVVKDNINNEYLNDETIKAILTGKPYIEEAKDTSFITKEGKHEIQYTELYDKKTPQYDPENFVIGSSIKSMEDKYGWKVLNYNQGIEDTGCWRLFYQDEVCTYLISDNCIGSYKLDDYIASYQNGAQVSNIGQRLNKKLFDEGSFFVSTNENLSLRAIAWLTDDTESSPWKMYKNEDALFAIGSPTIELLQASFNATADKNEATAFSVEVDTYGYTQDTIEGQMGQYKHGIYSKNGSPYWLASPANNNNYSLLYTYMAKGSINKMSISLTWMAVRPIVCISTEVFNEKYASSLINE